MDRLTTVARERGESPESLITEAVMLFLDMQWPELYEPGPDPLVGLFAGPSDLTTQVYAICNCCACRCGAMQAHQRGRPMLASSGYVAAMDADLRIGCGSYVGLCQFAAISLEEGLAVVDSGACMGCGVCALKCSEGALSLARDPGRGEPLEIQALIASAIPAERAEMP